MQSLPDDGRVENSPGVEKVAKPTTVCGAERGKPVGVSSEGSRKIASKGVEREQSPTTPLRVEDDGKSEGRPVTGRTNAGHNTLCKKRLCDGIARKCAHFRRVNPGESACRRTWYKQTYNPPTMDGKHTDAAPALPKSLALAGSGNASVTGQHAWHLADWGKATRSVRSLQVRIAEAYRNKRYRKMKALQNVLRRSLAAKMLVPPVAGVTENTGKRTLPMAIGMNSGKRPKQNGRRSRASRGEVIGPSPCAESTSQKRTARNARSASP